MSFIEIGEDGGVYREVIADSSGLRPGLFAWPYDGNKPLTPSPDPIQKYAVGQTLIFIQNAIKFAGWPTAKLRFFELVRQGRPREEQCKAPGCGRMKDLGKTCWWCGAK